jgi:RHS repeat-associated protein
MKVRMLRLILIIGIIFAVRGVARAQQTGFPPFGSFQNGQFDAINLQDLNVHFSIPVISGSGRGLGLTIQMVYDSLIWQNQGGHWMPVTDNQGNPMWGWKTDYPIGLVYYTSQTGSNTKCYQDGQFVYLPKLIYSKFSYLDPSGTSHAFSSVGYTFDQCLQTIISGTSSGTAPDESGYYISSDPNGGSPINTVYNRSGVQVNDGYLWAKDTNGNFIQANYIHYPETDWVDTVGRTAAKIIPGSNSIQFQFLDGTGTNTYKIATLKLTSTPILTSFGCYGVSEWSGTANLPTELDIPSPNNSSTLLKYFFSYEPSQTSGYYTGRLQKVVLPTGGYYQYLYITNNDGANCSDGTTLNMNRYIYDGNQTASWDYNRWYSNSVWHSQFVGPYPSQNTYSYTFNASGQETQRQVNQGNPPSTLLRTVNTTWASNNTPATVVTILDDGTTQSEVDTTYDSNGLLDSTVEYDYGSGAKGPLVRTTNLSYQTNSSYTARRIMDRVTTVTISDSLGTTKYRQDTAYDGSAITNCPTGVPQHDDTNYGCSMNYRGNPTSVTTYMDPVTPAQGVVTGLTYDVFGNVLQGSVSGTQQTQFNFSATTEYANPDSIVSGPSTGTQLTSSFTYFSDTGLVHTAKDPNNQQTSYTYDFLKRLTGATRPDSSNLTYSYNDSAFTSDVTTPIDSSRSVQQITTFNGLGQPYTSTVEDNSNAVYSIVQTNYDAMGRPYRTSNPYTSSPSYWTTTTFDALFRPTQVQLQDNSSISYSYSANTATVTDPAGKKRKTVSDGAGRLAKVFEPDVTNGNALTVETDYTYTVLDSLTAVSQGVQTRTYKYDALGRVASVATPEAGTVCFGTYSGSSCQNGYDNFGNLLSRTDARGVVTGYAYDSLNRLIGISYPTVPSGVSAMPDTICNPVSGSANSNVCFYYDQGGSSVYAMGRLTKMVDASGSETYTYNNLGETTQLQKVIGGNAYTIQYAYNTAGELTQLTYPSLHNVYQSYDAIGRLCEVAGSTITGNCGATTTPYTSGFSFNTAQRVTGYNYGNGVAATVGYSNDRLQMNTLSYAKSGTTLFGLNYSYGTSGSNNGQITKITDNVDNGRTATYSYDALLRLSNASTVGSSAYPAWGLSWTYDRYANRTAQSISSGCALPMTCPTNSVTVSASTNQITTSPTCTPYCYDLSGNMTNDGYNTLVYDGEDRATSTSNPSAAATYTYDGNGLRVQKAVHNGTSTVYVFSGSQVIAEYENGASVGSPTREYLYSGGQLKAKTEGSGTSYYHPDRLSTRLMTDSSGNKIGEQGHFPYGETWYLNNTTTKWEYTSFERDAEAGNDYAMARSDVSRLGRFLSTDPLGGSASDPQSLNRFAYVENDPINLTDPTGLFINPDPGDPGGGGGGCDPSVDPTCGGGCDPSIDPTCGGCDPSDPTCGGGGGSSPTPTYWPAEPAGGFPAGPDYGDGDGPFSGTLGCESLGLPCGMNFPTRGGLDVSGCTYGSGYCGGGIYGFTEVPALQGLTQNLPQDVWSLWNMFFSGRGGGRKGERKRTGKPENPRKHVKPVPGQPGRWQVKDPQTGKWYIKPPGWNPETAQKVGIWGAIGAAGGYIISTAPEWGPVILAF